MLLFPLVLMAKYYKSKCLSVRNLMNKLWHLAMENIKAPNNLIPKHVSKLKSSIYNSYVDGYYVFFKDV